MKKIAFILALILAFTPILVSCKGDAANNGSGIDLSGVAADSSSGDAVKEFEYTLDNLELDFGGKDFGIYIDKGGAAYLLSEEETGDLVGDAVFQRNLAIEDKFNCNLNIVESEHNQPTGLIRNFILADDKTYHMYVNVTQGDMPKMILQGYFVDWNEMEYLDYTKPYWNTRVATDINFGGKVYQMGGDLNLTTYNSTNCIIFNKNLFDDLGIEYPYQDVYDYTWTFDKFHEIVKQGYADLNGNSIWDTDGDRMGFSGWTWEMPTAVYIGMGGKPVIADEDGLPVLNLSGERNVDIIDNIIKLFDKVNAFNNGVEYSLDKNMLREGRLLMDDVFVTSLGLNRNSDFEFGVVPYPMLDEEQGEYYCRAANIAHLCYVPTTNVQLEETGIILEGMSIESHNNLRPVYYDVTLDLKSATDDETPDMVDIILDSSTYMYEGFINTGTIDMFIKSQTNTYASWSASAERAFEKEVQIMREFYSK